jgi:hypothetical protein
MSDTLCRAELCKDELCRVKPAASVADGLVQPLQ